MLIRPKITDSFFGKMTVVEEQNSFHGTIYFAPLKTDVYIRVYSNSSGPNEKHGLFYKEIEKKYFDCIEPTQGLIEEEFQKQKKTFSIINFAKEFELTGVNILQLENGKSICELEYVTPHVADGFITIQFIDWVPREMSFVQ